MGAWKNCANPPANIADVPLVRWLTPLIKLADSLALGSKPEAEAVDILVSCTCPALFAFAPTHRPPSPRASGPRVGEEAGRECRPDGHHSTGLGKEQGRPRPWVGLRTRDGQAQGFGHHAQGAMGHGIANATHPQGPVFAFFESLHTIKIRYIQTREGIHVLHQGE